MIFQTREEAPLNNEQWEKIDQIVVQTASKLLVGRRFLPIFGPLDSKTQIIFADVKEKAEDPAAVRKFFQLKEIWSDFNIIWNDIELILSNGKYDYSQVYRAATEIAKKEDEFIFFGCHDLNIDGILSSTGANKIKKSDWEQEDNAFSDVVKGLEVLFNKGYVGKMFLVVSPDIYVKLSRLNRSVGILEIERIAKLIGQPVLTSSVLPKNKAVLINPEFSNIDLTIGQDIITTYMGNDKLDHEFRIMETLTLRIKNKDCIVIYE